MTAPALVAFCARCQPECDGHVKPPASPLADVVEMIGTCRMATEIVVRELGLRANLAQRYEDALTRIVTGAECRGSSWCAAEAERALSDEG